MNFLGICALLVQSIANCKKILVFLNKLTISKKQSFRVRRVIGDIMSKKIEAFKYVHTIDYQIVKVGSVGLL